MRLETLLVIGSAGVTLMLWVASELILTSNLTKWRWWGRGVWTAGCLALLLHFVLAFALKYAWSLDAAVTETARQTNAVFGVRTGSGIWFNFALLTSWLVSVAFAWMDFGRWERPGISRRVRRGAFWFMWFNAACVFAPGSRRGGGATLCGVVMAAWIVSIWRSAIPGEAGKPGT